MAAVGGAGAAASTAPHDCVKAVQHYITKILKPRDKTKEIQGMKCLLLDKETKTIVAMVYSMNDILAKEVFLVESLDAPHESTAHMKAVVLVRPTLENVRVLAAQLREPKFCEYHIFFTNIVPQDLLRKLADADSLGLVKQVQEFYADFYAVNPDTFSLNLGGTLALSRSKAHFGNADNVNLSRCASGLLSLLLSFKVKPYVRYVASSDAAAQLARDVAGAIGGERELFTFNRGTGGAPLLLVLDRKEDPVTPLLTQWTYQAMVHELLPGGIRTNRVDLKHAKGVSKDLEEVVLSGTDDAFFREHMYANFGDVGSAVNAMLEDYKSRHSMHDSISSIEDMQRFVDKYPELKSAGLAVGKHVALMGEIAAAVEAKRLLEVSEVEQNVACSDAPNDQLRDIQTLLTNAGAGIDPLQVLRLVMLYTLRYEKSRPDRVAELRRFVAERYDVHEALALVDALIALAGTGQRAGDLFGASGGVLTRLSATVKRNVSGIANVYTQHQPLLTSLLDQLAKGKLSRTAFPFVGAEPPPGKISTVIVFYVGGTTYEEAAKVADINAGRLQVGGTGGAGAGAAGGLSPAAAAAPPPFRVVLGGTTIHNSQTFLAELQRISGAGGGGGAHVSVDMDGLR